MKKFNGANRLMKLIMRTSLIYTILSILFLNLVHASSVNGQVGLDKKIAVSLQLLIKKKILLS